MIDNRIKRLKIFEEFQNAKPNYFEEKKEKETKYKKFNDYYSLCICPRGRNGGISKRLYEIFYGSRLYDKEEQIRSDFSTETKQLTETGCTLSFALNDHGYVAIILYPGKTDYTSPIETCIFIKNYMHPKHLIKSNFMERQWRYFNSYMEMTSIDGKATIFDKLRVFYLRNFKNKVIDGKYQTKPITTALLTSLKFIFNVGLSGFIIYLFTILPTINASRESRDEEKNSLQFEIVNLKKAIKRLNSYHTTDTLQLYKDLDTAKKGK